MTLSTLWHAGAANDPQGSSWISSGTSFVSIFAVSDLVALDMPAC